MWDPPRQLAFDVTRQPLGMTETSPYNHVYAPHLQGYPESLHGEFRLQALADGTTRLSGTTWYRLPLTPQWYWTGFSDSIIHAIHHRVLLHIAASSEGSLEGVNRPAEHGVRP